MESFLNYYAINNKFKLTGHIFSTSLVFFLKGLYLCFAYINQLI